MVWGCDCVTGRPASEARRVAHLRLLLLPLARREQRLDVSIQLLLGDGDVQLLWALVLVVVGVVAARHRRHLRREIVVIDDLRLHVFGLRLVVAVAVAAVAVVILGDRLRRTLEPAAAAAAGARLGARTERGELMPQLLELLLQCLYRRGSEVVREAAVGCVRGGDR